MLGEGGGRGVFTTSTPQRWLSIKKGIQIVLAIAIMYKLCGNEIETRKKSQERLKSDLGLSAFRCLSKKNNKNPIKYGIREGHVLTGYDAHYNGSFFTLHTDLKTWDESLSSCLGQGGRLAVLNSTGKQSVVWEQIKQGWSQQTPGLWLKY